MIRMIKDYQGSPRIVHVYEMDEREGKLNTLAAVNTVHLIIQGHTISNPQYTLQSDCGNISDTTVSKAHFVYGELM